jgi:hypothetical protein
MCFHPNSVYAFYGLEGTLIKVQMLEHFFAGCPVEVQVATCGVSIHGIGRRWCIACRRISVAFSGRSVAEALFDVINLGLLADTNFLCLDPVSTLGGDCSGKNYRMFPFHNGVWMDGHQRDKMRIRMGVRPYFVAGRKIMEHPCTESYSKSDMRTPP